MDWNEIHKNVFKNSVDTIKFLKTNHCFLDDWRENCKHSIHHEANKSDKGYQAVEEFFRYLRQENADKLLVSDLLLVRVPTTIRMLTNLKSLCFNELDIQQLPDDLKYLTGLESINVTKCKITEISSWMSSLTNLHTLNISRCKVRSIDENLTCLSKLDTLCLSFNELRSLPGKVLEMTSLQRLVLDCNPVNIPWNESSFPQLLMLNISETEIKTVPATLVSHLIQLIWSNCKDIILPEDFGTTLTHLNLAGNQLTSIPEQLKSLKSLTYLNISSNKLDDTNIGFIQEKLDLRKGCQRN